MDGECRQCGREFYRNFWRRKYICCNGLDCACGGETLPSGFCSVKCYEDWIERRDAETAKAEEEV